MPTLEPKKILKAHQTDQLAAAAFNFEDFRRQCDEYLQKVRAAARQILQEATQQAEQLRQAAYQQAKEQARQDALKEADAEINRRAAELAEQKARENLQTLVPAMQQAAEKLQREYQAWLGRWEESAVRLSVAIAERILKHQLDVDPQTSSRLISEALRLISRVDRLTIRLHPDDVAALGDQPEQFVSTVAHAGQVHVVPDPEVGRGGCVIETQTGSVDARIETLLERIVQELLQQTDDPHTSPPASSSGP